MKLAILFAFLLVSTFALRVDIERKEIERDDKIDLKAAISQGNVKPVTGDEIKRTIRGEYTPLTKNMESMDQLENPVIDLDNFQDLQYFGPINIGSEDETFKVVYDTGSGWIYINTKGCDGCGGTGHQFDPSTSSTFESTGEEKTLSYGKGQVTGVIAHEQFSVPGSETVDAVFVPATSGKDNEGAQSDGIVGLTPVATGGEDLFVDRLADAGIIDAREFTTYIAHENEQSYIDFGTNHDVSDSEITWVDLQNLPTTDRLIYWSAGIDSLTVGDEKLSLKYDTGILDTGTSLIGFNPTDLAKVVQKLADGRQIYNIQNQFYAIKCDGPSEVEGIEINVGGFNVEIPSTEFIIQEQGYCIFFLVQMPMPATMLGDSFLRGLRIIHDQEGQRVGFIPKDSSEPQSFLK